MKRIIVWLLTLAMLLALVGCSSSDDVRGTVTGQDTAASDDTSGSDAAEPEAQPTEDTSGDSAEQPEEAEDTSDDSAEQPMDDTLTDEEIPAEDSQAESTSEEEDSPIALGTNDGMTYENAYLGIGVQLDSDWVFYTDEEILAVNNLTQDLVGDDEELAELLENASSLQDMYASTDEGLTTLNVIMTKMSALEAAAFAISPDNLFAESYDALSSSVASALEAMGCTQVTVSEFQDCTFAGHDGKLLQVNGLYDDSYPIYESMVMFVKGDRLVAVTACTWLEDQTLSLLNLFYSL